MRTCSHVDRVQKVLESRLHALLLVVRGLGLVQHLGHLTLHRVLVGLRLVGGLRGSSLGVRTCAGLVALCGLGESATVARSSVGVRGGTLDGVNVATLCAINSRTRLVTRALWHCSRGRSLDCWCVLDRCHSDGCSDDRRVLKS